MTATAIESVKGWRHLEQKPTFSPPETVLGSFMEQASSCVSTGSQSVDVFQALFKPLSVLPAAMLVEKQPHPQNRQHEAF